MIRLRWSGNYSPLGLVWLLGPKFPGKIFPAGNRLKQEQNSGIIFPTSGLGEKSPQEKAGNPSGFE
jgi:hypothetical protein